MDKFNFDNQSGQGFYEESDLYAGEDMTLQLVKINDENIKFIETFKSGQDFEYVKYVLSKKLDVSIERIQLFLNDKPIIPLYSICDVEHNSEKVIMFKVNNEEES
jgi:hypothetical protein